MFWHVTLCLLMAAHSCSVEQVEPLPVPMVMYSAPIGPMQEPPYLLPAKVLPEFKPIQKVNK